MAQVDGLMERVPGSAGVMVQFVIALPPSRIVEGITFMAELTEPVVPVEVEKLIVGATAATLRLTTVPVLTPTELVAVTV